MLWRPHDHHREVRTKRNAHLPSEPADASHQERHLVTLSLQISNRYLTYSRWLAARRGQAREHSLNSQTAVLAITPPNLQRVHLHQPTHRFTTAKISLHPSRPHLVSIADLPKSP